MTAPAPLTPSDCDLRDFQFMPVDIVRLFASEFHALASDAEWRAGVTLWLKSFHQVPAGSMPDDDVQLCRAAELGRDLKAWRKVKERAMHGWVLCDDGRWYHPTVCEKANEAWARKQFQRERSRKANEARWARDSRQDEPESGRTGEAHGEDDALLDDSQQQSKKASKTHPSSILERSQGTGIGTGKDSVPNGTVSDRGLRKADLDDLWAMAPAPSRERSSRKDLERSLKAALNRGATLDRIKAGLAAYFDSPAATKDHGAFVKGIHRMVENDRWAEFAPAVADPAQPSGSSLTVPTETRQRLWMQDFLALPHTWREHERGPRPGAPGCRVVPAIQREFGVEPAGVAA